MSVSLSLEGSKEEASFQVQSPGPCIMHSPPSLQNHNELAFGKSIFIQS